MNTTAFTQTISPANIGPGSQAPEADGAVLDIFAMPSGMDTYSHPDLPEPSDVEDLEIAKNTLKQLLNLTQISLDTSDNQSISLLGMDEANLSLIDQVLGEGEVSIVIKDNYHFYIQESVLAGIWRIKGYDTNKNLISDWIELGKIPLCVLDLTFKQASTHLEFNEDTLPEDVLNAPPLIAEINDKLNEYDKAINVIDENPQPYVLNLSLLPQTEGDISFLDNLLAKGCTQILSRGYGNCRISSTQLKNVWWVQYFNSQDSNILNTLEIIDIPEVALAAKEDLADSYERLEQILTAY